MRIACIVQRFGPGVEGGAERHCELLATRLAETDEVEILTSTCKDMGKWHENQFPAGPDSFAGLTVRRFRTIDLRGPFELRHRWLNLRRRRPATMRLSQQLAWLEGQGPCCPDLLSHLEARRDDFDVFVFFTYLYHPTAVGLLRVADKAALIPTAHDEPQLKLEVFRPLFVSARMIVYNTVEEQALVEHRFHNEHVASIVGGVGIDPPELGTRQPDGEDIVYVGRLGPNKLFDLVPYFLRYAAERRPGARLVLVGRQYVQMPDDPRIVITGFVSEHEKWAWMRRARVFVMPSAYESLSMVLLEAWAAGAPALVNGRCAVLAGHVERCGGGLAYRSYREFADGLDALLDDRQRAEAMGQRGQRYVQENYRWDVLLPRIRAALQRAAKKS